MLQSLLPKAHQKFRALPLLGSAADGFDDWLAANGYTPGSREFSIRFLIHADADLRKRGVRDLLRFLSTDGRVRTGLDRQIDTPRVYRLEQLPRSLPWDTVTALLKSIDQKTAMGLRDYAMFLLIATYGLRASEVVAISLDDIHWRRGVLRIHQRKTSSPLELPLTNEVLSALVKHLKRTPPPEPYRRIFLRMRAPMGVLKPTAVTEAFQALVRKSGLSISYQGPHCMRHAYALRLLKNGTPLKTIGDILGHRTAEATCMYLRLATGDLREVALAVPSARTGKERQ